MSIFTGAGGLGDLLKEIGDAFETKQNKWDRAGFDAKDVAEQQKHLQNAYDNGMKVKEISKKTDIPESTIYSKINTKK